MAVYSYKAKKGPSEIVEGQLEAESPGHAIDKLSSMGLVPITVAEKIVSGLTAEPVSGSRYPKPACTAIGIKTGDVDIFTRQLSGLIKAGVPVLRALSLISQQTENKSLTNVVSVMEQQIRDGKMLSDALGGYPRLFNNLYVNMVKSGEKSGALNEVLNNMTQYRQKEQDIRQKIQAALAYPVLIIIVGIATVFIILTFFLPKLISLLENMKQSLPLSTRILIRVSEFMAGNWYLFLIAFIFIFAIFARAKPGSRKKLLFDFIKLRLPVMKRFIRDIEVARFARTLAMLVKNGIPVCDGLELATGVLDNDVFKAHLKRARKDVIDQGYALSNSFKKTGIFPLFVTNMISVGEEGGKLEDSLKTIADVYEGQAEQAIKIMASLLEPLLILVIGIVVGFIVFSMLLPVFNIGVTMR